MNEIELGKIKTNVKKHISENKNAIEIINIIRKDYNLSLGIAKTIYDSCLSPRNIRKLNRLRDKMESFFMNECDKN